MIIMQEPKETGSTKKNFFQRDPCAQIMQLMMTY